MSDIKWIKLTTNVFDDEKFDAIKVLPYGNEIQLAWVKLLCLAGTCNENGFLVLTNEIPYTDEMLARRFSMDIGIVQRAMTIFQNLEMVEVVDNAYMVSNWLKYQNGDELEKFRESNRERQKRFREKQKQLLLEGKENSNVTDDVKNNVNRSISYSISFNNLNNLKALLDSNTYSNSEYIKSNEALLETISDWMSYKDERTPKKNNHYTEKGMKSLLTEIIKHDQNYGTDAVVQTINHTIANQWQGIFWDWMEKKFAKIDNRQTVKQDEFQEV